jgi:hypothetical protein
MGKFHVCREADRKLSANLKALGKSSVFRSDTSSTMDTISIIMLIKELYIYMPPSYLRQRVI